MICIVYLALCCYSKNSVPYYVPSIRSIANPIIIKKFLKYSMNLLCPMGNTTQGMIKYEAWLLPQQSLWNKGENLMRKRKVLQAIKYSSLNSFKYQSTHFWFHSIKEKSNEKITSTRQVWKGGIEKWLAADVSNLKLNPNTNILTAHLIESKIYFHVSTIRIVDRLSVY